MDNSVKITLIIVAGVVLLGFLAMSSMTIVSPSNTVNVNGQASITSTPDVVKVYFNIQTVEKTSQDAKDKNAEIVDNVVTALIKEGFNRNEIKTEGYNIYPNYDYNSGRNTITGYTASQSLIVEIDAEETEKIGKVVDAGVDAGAGINYISFELSQEKQNQLKAEAIKLAAEDAKTKAQALAEGLGKRLGALVSTSDNSFDYNPWVFYESRGVASDAMEAKQAATSIQPSDREVTARVSATFKIY